MIAAGIAFAIVAVAIAVPAVAVGFGGWLFGGQTGLIISGSNQRPNSIPSACTWSASGARPPGYFLRSTTQSPSAAANPSSRWRRPWGPITGSGAVRGSTAP